MNKMSHKSIPLVLRNIFFVILQPGMVAGLIPFLLAKSNFQSSLAGDVLLHHVLGLLIFIAGLWVLFHCVYRFASKGKGTISPADPTTRLVTSGLYKYSRNPMYVGVMMILIGEVVFIWSLSLLIYSLGIFILFHLFIIYKEEPRLKKDFGQEYEKYCKKVRRWL